MIANLQAHYGFTRMPFGTAIPVDALYASAAHKEAVARLRWLISARGLGVADRRSRLREDGRRSAPPSTAWTPPATP